MIRNRTLEDTSSRLINSIEEWHILLCYVSVHIGTSLPAYR